MDSWWSSLIAALLWFLGVLGAFYFLAWTMSLV